MTEWVIPLIMALLGGSTVASIVSSIFYRRENKEMKQADLGHRSAEVDKEIALSRKEDASAAQEMLKVLVDVKTVLLGFNETLKETIAEKDKAIDEKNGRISDLERQVKELSYTVTSQNRRIKGMQKVIEINIKALKDQGVFNDTSIDFEEWRKSLLGEDGGNCEQSSQE